MPTNTSGEDVFAVRRDLGRTLHLVAIDGDRVDAATFNVRFAEKQIGSPVAITVMRNDRMVTKTVTVGQEEKIAYSIKEKAAPTALQKEIYTSWLGEK